MLLLLINQFVASAQAASHSSIIVREECPSSCADGCSKRTLFNIIWGCLSTTIICAWTTLHPNIPPREGPLKAMLRRLELMFWTIMGPEILPTWALSQRLAAMKIRDIYNNGKGYEPERRGIWKTMKSWVSMHEIKEAESQAWTLKHGHFLIMGGFHLVEPPANEDSNSEKQALAEPAEGRVTILTLEMLEELVKDPDFKIRITEDEITHRSKGDALSKLIFILQTSWFIVQCVARWVQGLGLTQLELTTLALASLNGITFVLWWNKPLGAQAVVRLHLNRRLTDQERDPEERDQSIRSLAFTKLREVAASLATGIRDIILRRSQGNILVDWLIRLPLFILPLLLLPVIVFGIGIFATANDILGGSFSCPADATHVPTFYAPGSRHRPFHMLLLMVLAVLFGGIHCAGWNFTFPTSGPQKLWRVASLSVPIISIVAFPLSAIISYIFHRRRTVFKGLFLRDSDYEAGFTFFIMMVAYSAARLVLLGLALILLGHQPPSSFISINWTTFYPHIL